MLPLPLPPPRTWKWSTSVIKIKVIEVDRLSFLWILIGLSCKAKRSDYWLVSAALVHASTLTFCTLSAHIPLIYFPSYCLCHKGFITWFLVKQMTIDLTFVEAANAVSVHALLLRFPWLQLAVRRRRGQAATSQQGASGSPFSVHFIVSTVCWFPPTASPISQM